MTQTAELSPGACALPRRHLSIRVPWHDNGWAGHVCRHPAQNTSCLVLPGIRKARQDDLEAAAAGRSWETLASKSMPPCWNERASFMAPFPLRQERTHPYAYKSPGPFSHLLPTSVPMPAYSALVTPYGWTLRRQADEIADELQLGLQMELEADIDAALEKKAHWLQARRNQCALLDTFFSAIKPHDSLCFFYAKRTPLSDEPRRVLIGVGRVTGLGQRLEYDRDRPHTKAPADSIIWERAVLHSIRPGFADGFLLPYHEILAHLETHPDLDPADYTAAVPDDQYLAFSYAAEHVQDDGAIAALLACSRALEHCATIAPGPWAQVQSWISARLGELWQMRGPYPGIGAVLQALGFQNAVFLAYGLERLRESSDFRDQDPWELMERVIRQELTPPAFGGATVEPTLRRLWTSLPPERRALVRLLSRFALTPDQAERFLAGERGPAAEVLANPYRLFETDRDAQDAVSLAVLDRGVFPDSVVQAQAPLPAPSRMDGDLDARRIRAYVVEALRRAEDQGHTLLTRADVSRAIRAQPLLPPLPVTDDILAAVESDFTSVVAAAPFGDGTPGYQLQEAAEYSALIRTTVTKRQRAPRHEAVIDWRVRLDETLGDGEVDADEQRARDEKAAALAEIFSARLSVLIGPAGTGKTTLLKILLQEPSIQRGRVLLLAPTGKARVRLEQQTQHFGRAQTIAQFLLDSGRYVVESGRYRLAQRGTPKSGHADTVVIDEASMLTEAQLAATLDALPITQRIILVGDPRQLPPIGAGRPFMDIVRHLTPPDLEARFPRIGPGYAELTVRRRQRGRERPDLLLAEWFSGRALDAGADEVWDALARGVAIDHVRCVRWETPAELEQGLIAALVDELELGTPRNVARFEQTLGGVEFNGGIYFHVARSGRPGSGAAVDAWQILSPVRNQFAGVTALNRLIQTTFRQRRRDDARRPKSQRRVPGPMGIEEIVYGDKVIHVRNDRRTAVYPDGGLQYVANGEVGLVVGRYKGSTATYAGPPQRLEVEFSTQPGYAYHYFNGRDFGDEGAPVLELAYALTIHKAQGSEFGLTLLVIPRDTRLLSRELLYTALTRHQNRVVLLHQGPLADLRRFTYDAASEAARRYTNLLAPPTRVSIGGVSLEGGLLHRTARGEWVRSASEVLIADGLFAHGLEYGYEQALPGDGGSVRYPAFSALDPDTGLMFYWEHLGLAGDVSAAARWARKLDWYRAAGIRPLAEGGGPKGIVVWSQDRTHEPLTAAAVAALIALVQES